MTYNPQKHHRRSIRLKGYDYTRPGAYFVTMVTYHRDEIFGKVVNGRIELSVLGEMVREEWLRSIGIRKEIRLFEDEMVVMPNHIHAIVWLVDEPNSSAHTVGADGIRPPGEEPTQGARRAPQPEPAPQQPAIQQRKPKSLGAFIAEFKAAVTSRARRELHMNGIWQRNYYEHIIRSKNEFMRIWDYIEMNPQQWESDQLHPSARPHTLMQKSP